MSLVPGSGRFPTLDAGNQRFSSYDGTVTWLGRGYMAAVRRFIRAAGRRAGEGDEFELAELAGLADTLAEAMVVAVAGQRTYGKSWAHIGAALGITREAAWQKWGKL